MYSPRLPIPSRDQCSGILLRSLDHIRGRTRNLSGVEHAKMTRRALITGITGQDGSYLAELLLAKGYEVHGLVRRASLFNTDRIDHLRPDPHLAGAKLSLHYGDLTDGSGLRRVLQEVDPDEVYNLGGQSHVRVSFDIPEYTTEVVAVGALRLLEALQISDRHGVATPEGWRSGDKVMVPPPATSNSPRLF